MSLNHREIDQILLELELEGMLIQKIRQPNYHSLLIDLYGPKQGRFPLLVELSPQAVRLHRLHESIPMSMTGKLQRFAQMLRSRISGGRITQACQIDSQRIVRLTIETREERLLLFIRLWSNAANIIATDTDLLIIDAFYRRPAKNEVSGRAFTLPEPAAPAKEFSIREGWDPQEMSLNRFIEHHYRTEDRQLVTQRLKGEALELLRTRIADASRQLSTLSKELEQSSGYQQVLHTADLLQANRQLIDDTLTSMTLTDWDEEQSEVTISLKQGLSASEQIERYYTSYRKLKGAYDNLTDRIEEISRRLEVLKESYRELEETTELSSLETRAREILSHGGRERGAKADGQGLLQFTSGIFTLLVGRTAKENDLLLRSRVRGNDWWMHTRDTPGGYVFIKNIPGKSIPLEVLLDAGNLALHYSKARSNGVADLYYTQVKYLRRAKGAKLGTVLPTQERNLRIELDTKRLDRLFASSIGE